MGHLPAKFGGEEIGTAHFEKTVVPALVSIISGKKMSNNAPSCFRRIYFVLI